MYIPPPPPQWRIPIVFVVALLISGVIPIPLILRGVLFGAVFLWQTIALWRRFDPGQPGNVTYWRGVKYETKRSGAITLADIQDNAIAVLTWLFALLLTVVFVMRFFGI